MYDVAKVAVFIFVVQAERVFRMGGFIPTESPSRLVLGFRR
jgi:hypothetical protein